MSVLINEKLHSHRLKWRWPLSRQVTLSIGTLAVLLTVWWAVAALQLISPLFLPPPQQVLAKLLTPCRAAGIYGRHAVAASGRQPDAHCAGATRGGGNRYSGRDRHGAKPDGARHSGSDNRALSSGAAAGLFAADGDLVWYWRKLEDLLIYLAIFAPVAMSALAGVKSVQQVRIRAARSLGASRAQVLWFVILPGALPEILTGLRIGLGVGWSTLVAAELIAATRGLGFMVQSAGEFLATDVVLAGIAVIAIIAFLLELGLRALQRRLTPRHGEVQ